nr:MAG TPA: tail tube protein [Bacteriophage sp.]
MAKLVWDTEGQKTYETGVEKCVLYPRASNGTYPKGVAWNGITSISENPSGAEASPLYADNKKYLSLMSTEELALSVEAYTYPEEYAECDGSAQAIDGVHVAQQRRKSFGLCYKTLFGNDTEGTDHGYKLHLVFGCLASPSEKQFSSVNESPEAISFSWEINTTPIDVKGFKPTALITIDSTKVNAAKLKALEDTLYGTDTTEAKLPLPSEVLTILGVNP